MGPIDYSINVESPMAAFGQGANVGAVFSDLQNKLLAAQQAQEQKKMIFEKKQELLSKKNRTAQDYTDLALLLPKEEGDNVRASWDTFGKDRQEKELRFGGEVMSAFHAGSNDVAIQLLQERAQAARNSGNEGEAASYETYAKLAQSNPSAAQTVIGTMIGAVPGGDKVLENTIKTLKAPSDIRQSEANAKKAEYEAQDTPERLSLNNSQTAANIRNLDSQIVDRANKFGLDKDKLQSDVQMKLYEFGQKGGELNDSAKKIINESTLASVSSRQSANQMMDLANKLETKGGGFGSITSAENWINEKTGRQDAFTQLRNEYARLKNSQVLKNVPKGGNISDKDIEFAKEGFLPETANSKQLAMFLRGMAKAQNYEAFLEDAKSEWVNSVGYLGKPKKDIEINGITVQAGSSFSDFAPKYVDLISKKSTANTEQKNQKNIISQRSYSRFGSAQIPK